jgi:formate hydrogenlyase transcriptional activator
MSMLLRVLVVEDSPDDAALILRELKKGDYEVTYRRVSSHDAMETALAEQEWDVVICDYSMPYFSGMDALRLQHAWNPDTPFIFLSGTIGEEAAIAALKEGAHDCLVKNDLKRLIPTVRRELRDADERKARKRLEQEVQDLQRMAGLASGIAQDLNNALCELLSTISSSLREVAKHDCAMLVLKDQGGGKPRILYVGEGSYYSRSSMEPGRYSRAWSSLDARQPAVLNLGDIERFTGTPAQHFIDEHMLSAYLMPLLEGDRSLGALAFGSLKENAFGHKEVQALTEIGHQIATAVGNALAFRQIADLRDRFRREKQYLEEEMDLEHGFEDIVGESAELRDVLRQIGTVAPTDATVLIQGETGTGKELLARAVHRLSQRRERTFIKLNCAAIPTGLLESELFGHEKGAFTGAISRKMGRLELAHEGTLFLDEIGELPLDLQPKLLRALQEREIERLGSNRPIPVNVRLIAATNRNLAEMVQEKQFRSDLFYRLKVFPIFAPPLRERTGDIPVLVRHFVAKHSRRMGKVIEEIPERTMAALVRWSWPGNVRELENFLERAVILTRGSALYAPVAELESELPEIDPDASTTLIQAEKDYILRVLREAKGKIGGSRGAATRLGLKRTTLNSKIKKLDIRRYDYM